MVEGQVYRLSYRWEEEEDVAQARVGQSGDYEDSSYAETVNTIQSVHSLADRQFTTVG